MSFAQTTQVSKQNLMNSAEHLQDYPVIEFRRYAVKEGERDHFATYFEAFFPEAFQQLGAIAAGEFLERDKPLGFTWIRGFHSMDDRARVNAAFYYGPLWKEHKATLNGLMTDSDNVLLLRPALPDRGIRILPAVDPVKEAEGAQGVVVAQIFAVKPSSVEGFIKEADKSFAEYRAAGVDEVALLTTLDAPNNFPQLPVRSDGPYVVWLGMVKDSSALDSRFVPVAHRNLSSFSNTGMLRNDPEVVILTPTRRSRLRWLEAR
jgi:hypothetical protein